MKKYDFKLLDARIQVYWQGWLNPLQGRMHRVDYFFYAYGSNLVAKFIDHAERFIEAAWLSLVVALIIGGLSILLSVCAVTKRLRDVNLSGWFAVPFFAVVIFGLVSYEVLFNGQLLGTIILACACIPSLYLLIKKPYEADNKYGIYDPITLWNSSSVLKAEAKKEVQQSDSTEKT